jgi:hypothetical protein
MRLDQVVADHAGDEFTSAGLAVGRFAVEHGGVVRALGGCRGHRVPHVQEQPDLQHPKEQRHHEHRDQHEVDHRRTTLIPPTPPIAHLFVTESRARSSMAFN